MCFCKIKVPSAMIKTRIGLQLGVRFNISGYKNSISFCAVPVPQFLNKCWCEGEQELTSAGGIALFHVSS